ncbi:MAG: helix-turn-helix transcriptional regulator [Patescibacteria group bacterium]|nr:helix-turn-helix transcriptional regulator [Patescibacteria group bacterium]
MLGQLIRILRKKHKIGVQEFAQKLGINRISLFRIEKEKRQPSEQTAIKAFKILGLSEESIYQIFILSELIKKGTISEKAKNKEARVFLKRLKKNDKNSKIIHRYFKKILKS